MKKLYMLLAAVLLMVIMGCGGGGGDAAAPPAPPSVDATGTWKGTVTSSLSGTITSTLSAVQLGSGCTGTYSTSAGGRGSVTGTVSGNTYTCTIYVTTPGCSGSFAATGTINATVTPNTMAFTYSGASNAACGGSESGTGNLIKQ